MAEALILDEACGEVESLSKVDGICDSPYVHPGQIVEVEGVELEEKERSIKEWSQVRRKSGQEEKDVAAETRGWEEFCKLKSGFPYLAHYWRYEGWREEMKRKWTKEELMLEQRRVKGERMKEYESWVAYGREVVKWVNGGGVD